MRFGFTILEKGLRRHLGAWQRCKDFYDHLISPSQSGREGLDLCELGHLGRLGRADARY